MATYRVTYSDGETVDVTTAAGEAGATAHADALEKERVGKALRVGVNLAPRGTRPDIEVLKADAPAPVERTPKPPRKA